MSRLDEIKKRVEAATEGPWRDNPMIHYQVCDGVYKDGHGWIYCGGGKENNKFIAHAREKFLAELEGK
jgi:hypothetical protein